VTTSVMCTDIDNVISSYLCKLRSGLD